MAMTCFCDCAFCCHQNTQVFWLNIMQTTAMQMAASWNLTCYCSLYKWYPALTIVGDCAFCWYQNKQLPWLTITRLSCRRQRVETSCLTVNCMDANSALTALCDCAFFWHLLTICICQYTCKLACLWWRNSIDQPFLSECLFAWVTLLCLYPYWSEVTVTKNN